MSKQSHYNDNTHFNVNPINSTTTSAAAYAFRPSHDPRNFPHYSLNDLPNYNYAPPLNSNKSVPSSSTTTTVIDKNYNKIQLPTWTNNVFPNRPVVEHSELVNWLTATDNPPSVLLIDIRPKELFKSGCIMHKWILQVDPIVLQKE